MPDLSRDHAKSRAAVKTGFPSTPPGDAMPRVFFRSTGTKHPGSDISLRRLSNALPRQVQKLDQASDDQVKRDNKI